MRRFAFIDASNIAATTTKVLGFSIDWEKLIKHLKSDRWNCEKVFYYRGNDGSEHDIGQIKKLEDLDYIVRTKIKMAQKATVKNYFRRCEVCSTTVSVEVKIPGPIKSNCDVELVVDAMECAAEGMEFLIFSGDGDFAYLVETLIEKGVMVKIVSNTETDACGYKTFSSRLKIIVEREQSEYGKKRITFVDIKDWKQKIALLKPKDRPQT